MDELRYRALAERRSMFVHVLELWDYLKYTILYPDTKPTKRRVQTYGGLPLYPVQEGFIMYVCCPHCHTELEPISTASGYMCVKCGLTPFS